MKRLFSRPYELLYVLCVAAAGFGDDSLLGGKGMALKALTLCAVPAALASLLRPQARSKRREMGYFALLFAFPLLISLLHALLVWSMSGTSAPFVLRAGQKLLFQIAALAGALSAFQVFGPRVVDDTFYGLSLANAAVILVHARSASPAAVLLGLSVGPLLGLGGEAGAFQTGIELHDITFCMGLFLLHYALYPPHRGARSAHLAAAGFFFLAGLKRIAVLGLLLALLAAMALRAACRRPFPRARLLRFSGVLVLLSFAYLLAIRAGWVTALWDALGIGMTGRDKIYRFAQPMYRLSPGFLGHGFQYTVALLRGMRDAGTQQIMVAGLHNDVLTLYIELGFFGFFGMMGFLLVALPALLGARYGLGTHRTALCMQLYLLTTYLTDNTMYYFFLTLVSRQLLMHASQEAETPLRAPRLPRPRPCASLPGRRSAIMPRPATFFRRILALLAVSCCAALLCGFAQHLFDARHASVILTLRTPSALSGKWADGTRLDVYALFDGEVLSAAAGQAGDSGEVSASSLGAGLRITPAVTREAEAAYVSAEYVVRLTHPDASARLEAICSACLAREARRLEGDPAVFGVCDGETQALSGLLLQHIQSRALEAPDFTSGDDSFVSLAAALRAQSDSASRLRERARALEDAFLAECMPLSFRPAPRDPLWNRLPLLAGLAAAAGLCLVFAVCRLFARPPLQRLRALAALLLALNALAGGAFLAWNAQAQVHHAEMLLSAYGSLHPSELVSIRVVEAAITQLNLPCGVEDIRSRVSIRPVIPADEQLRREALLAAGEPYSFQPTDFVVSFEADSALARRCGMGGARLSRLTLDALVACWIDERAERETALSLAASLPPAGADAEQRLLALALYAAQAADTANAWRCRETGLSFPTLALRAESARSQEEADALETQLRKAATAYAQRHLMTQISIRSSTHVSSSGLRLRRAGLFASFLLVFDGAVFFFALLGRAYAKEKARDPVSR